MRPGALLPLLLAALAFAGCADESPLESPVPPECGPDAACAEPGEPAPPPADPGLAWTWAAGGPSLPFGLAEAGAAQGDGRAALVGGFVAPLGGSPTVLDVGPAGAEPALPPYPLAVHHAQAAYLDGVLYVFGGYVGGAPNPLGAVGASSAGWPLTAAAFHLEGGAWVPIADLPEPRAAGGAVALDGRIYLVGGSTDEGHPASVLAYDPATDSYSEAAPLPTPRDHLNVVAHEGRVYAIAGRDIASAAVDDLPTFEAYDPVADAWEALPDCPLGRGGQAAAVLRGRIVVAGGERIEGDFTVYDDVHAYDVGNGTWVALPPMPEARHGGALVALGDRLVYLGGATLAGELASESLVLTAD